jgi:hypothetical protein
VCQTEFMSLKLIQHRQLKAYSRVDVRVYTHPPHFETIYSGPSSYDRLDIRKTWVTIKILVLTYDQDQILSYDPHAGQGHLSYDPHGVRKASVWAQIRVFVEVIPVTALLYIINFANCYQNGPPKKLENNFLVNTLGKLLVFLVNYAYYATLFYY